jgi:hypothetical protein
MCLTALILLGSAVAGDASPFSLVTMAILGPLSLGSLAWGIYLFVRNRRVVVGPESLQVIDGRDRVVGNIPYTNIIHIRTTLYNFDIILLRRKRKDTWWCKRYCGCGYDIHLIKHLSVNATALRMLLMPVIQQLNLPIEFEIYY